jgi:hypothetical protein
MMATLKVLKVTPGRVVNGKFVAINPTSRKNIPGYRDAQGRFHPITPRKGETFDEDYRGAGGRWIPLKRASKKKKGEGR